jgi:ubiquinone/menaquinone biosynthesis C-methylase UbiE
MSQAAKPTGILGKILARGMAWGHREFYRNAARELDLREDDDFLEIGFGSGLFISRYAKHVKRIAGIDYSNDMVELASSINRGLMKSGKMELRTGESSFLPWRDSSFSAVAAIETFYFWQEPESSLQQVYRVLRKNGRLIIEMSFNKDDGIDHTNDVKKTNLILYSQNEIENMLQECGFAAISFSYFRALWIPFKGYVVPRGMVAKALKL